MNNQSNNSFPPSPPPNRRKFLVMVGYIGLGATITYLGGKVFNSKPSSVVSEQNETELSQNNSESTETLETQIQTFDLGDGVILEMVKIPAGGFTMGSPPRTPRDPPIPADPFYYTPDPDANDNEFPRHQVTVREFYLGKYEITQAQYFAIMETNPSVRKKGDNYPVENLSWNDAQEFCQKLSAKTGKIFRLPSEAQWEYACRAGTQTRYHFGDNYTELTEYGWSSDNSAGTTHVVGDKKPNNFGLYDMHGNVFEFCEDHWHDNYFNAPSDDNPWLDNFENNVRVAKSGAWFYNSLFCRSASRVRTDLHLLDGVFGFRVALFS